ncbi:MAG: mechanosensitive ion channel domain-containing protein, partial [Pseudomonadota bacterium]
MTVRSTIYALAMLICTAVVFGSLDLAEAQSPPEPAAEAASETAEPALRGVVRHLNDGQAGASTERGATEAPPDPDAASDPNGSAAEQARPPEDAGTEPDQEALNALRRVLSDPEARGRLLGALAAIGAQTGDSDEGGAEGGAEDEQPPEDGTAAAEEANPEAQPRLSLGRRVAEITRDGVREIVETLTDFYNGVRTTQRRLSGFANVDTERLAAIAEDIGITLISTFATLFLLRIFATPVWRRLARYASGGSYTRGVVAIAISSLLDLITLLMAWATGYAFAVFGRGEAGDLSVHEALFLNAFLVVEFIKAVIRAFLAPSEGLIRPLPLTDRAAVYWHRWSNFLISLLGYGLMLAVPLVNDVVNLFTGRATTVLIFAVFLLISMVLVILNRKAPAAYFRRRAEDTGGDVTLGTIAYAAHLFPLAIIAYLITLFVLAVADTGQVGPAVILTLKVIGVVAIGVAAVNALSRASNHGVRLPGTMTRTLPMLEQRLNTFVPAFLSIVRFVVFVAVIGAAIDIVGLFNFSAWLDGELGGDAAAIVTSVVLIVLGAFVIWIAIMSWIDFRLTPRGFRIVTSREQTLLTLLRNAASIAIIVVATMFSLSEIGINIAPLIASAGVFGLAIGFGAQKLVQDIITGVFIQFENACNVGDVITVGGITGTVEKLTIRSVSLRDLYGTYHVIPFSSVDMVSNFMRGFAYHVADLGIAYREDVEEAKQAMLDCFAEMQSDRDWGGKIIGDLDWFGVQSLGDSSVVLRARIKTIPGQQWGVGRRYNELLKKTCDARGIEIPFPHMTIWMG